MIDYVRRLARTGTAYTASSVLAKVFAVFLLPVYTKYVPTTGYGQVETLLVSVVVLSIMLRFGMIEAVLRFYHRDEHPREQVLRTGFWGLLATATAGSVLAFVLAPQFAEWLWGGSDAASIKLFRIAAVGLWFFTFYELLLAYFRVDERAGAYAAATIANVLITIPLTVWLVVVADRGAEGLLLGNFLGTGVIVLALLAINRRRIGPPGVPLAREMLRFGLPTMPAEVSLYALNFADRVMLIKLASTHTQGLAAAGLYSVAAKFAQGLTVFVRAFQLAWPPLAYSIVEDREARVVYGRVLTYYLVVTSAVVTALALVSRWIARLLVDDSFYESYRAVPLIATGVALYGAYLVLTSAVARVNKTGSLFPIAITGLVVNVGLCVALIPSSGIAGAGMALVGAYLVILGLMYLRARSTLGIVLEWRRIVHVVAAALAVAFSGEYLLPEAGFAGLAGRVGWWFLLPASLVLTGFFRSGELAALKQARARLKSARDSKTLPDGAELVDQMKGPE